MTLSSMPSIPLSYNLHLDMRLAAQWWGYTWEEFLDKSREEQARLVATRQASNILAYYATKYAEEQARRKMGKR